MKTVVQKLDIKLKDNPLTEQIKFPFDGLCSITLIGSAPFSYQFHSIDTDTWYSDKPLLCRNKKELLPFGSYKGRIFSFEFKNVYRGDNTVTLHAEYSDKSFNDKEYSFREYTLDGLNRKSSVVIEAGQEAEVFLTNFRGGHYEVHEIYSSLDKRFSCKIRNNAKIIDRFRLENMHSFKRPWILRWPDSAILCLKNEDNTDLKFQPTDIYFAGYLIKPTEVIERISPINARDSFLIEGIRLK